MEGQGSKWWYVSHCSRLGAYLGAMAPFPQYPLSYFMAIVCPLNQYRELHFKGQVKEECDQELYSQKPEEMLDSKILSHLTHVDESCK